MFNRKIAAKMDLLLLLGRHLEINRLQHHEYSPGRECSVHWVRKPRRAELGIRRPSYAVAFQSCKKCAHLLMVDDTILAHGTQQLWKHFVVVLGRESTNHSADQVRFEIRHNRISL